MPAASGSSKRRRESAPRAAVRRLYRGVDGFEIPRREEWEVRSSRGDPLYGELTPASVEKLLDYLRPGPRDVFYDLGAGIGKVVVQASMTAPLKKCVGVELSATRCHIARSTLRRARREGLVLAKRCSFRQEDLLASNLRDATLVYTCSTAFSTRFMRLMCRKLAALERPLLFATLQDLDPHPGFEPVEVLRLDVTWRRRTPVYIYRLVPERAARPRR